MTNESLTWSKSHGSMYENFALDLESFTSTGKYPSDAGQVLKYGLELQFERLKEKNLKMRYGISPRGLLSDDRGASRQWKDQKYVTRMEFRSCSLSREIYRDDRKVYETKKKSIFYQFITDARDANAIGDEPYACPNCGAVSKISVLQSGCPFCQTYFSMRELFPKVTNYYFLPDVSYTGQELKHTLKRVMLPCIVISILAYTIFFYLWADAAKEGIARILSALLPGVFAGVIFGGIIGYLAWAAFQIGSLFVQAGQSTPMLVNTAGSGKRFVTFMSRYSPEFSYEYFSEKVVSMLKMLIYSPNPSDLPYYEGEPLGDRFRNIIESSYAGAVALKSYGVRGDDCHVIVEVYLENLYGNGSRIEAKKEKVRVELRRNVRKPLDMHFSIEKIQCKSCGASFNAAKMRNCPHCGTRYEIGDDDWIISKIKA